MKQFIYHPMHMHIHTCFQPGMSMAAHLENAKKLGMEYIWFTDHDVRTGKKRYPVEGFVFDTEELIKTDDNKRFCGFEQIEFPCAAESTYKIDTERKLLKFKAVSNQENTWQSAGLAFISSGTRHTAALLMGITLTFSNLSFVPKDNARLIFDVRLSQRPGDLQPAHLMYVMGSREGLEAPHTQILPCEIKDNTVVLPLSKDVSDEIEIGGKDNVFNTVTVTLQVKNGEETQVSFGDFRIAVEHYFEDAHIAQKKEAERLEKLYNVYPFVSVEISDAGEHKNVFSTHVPTMDYAAHNYQITPFEAATHVKQHDGIFAFNHPLAISKLKRKTFSEFERLKVVSKTAAELCACNAYGADLIEVGFPEGRNGFSIEEYAYLWDLLSVSGLILTGYGSSDSHRNNDGWFDKNNFATYVGVPKDLPYPVKEEVFVQAMKTGNVYTGDPTKLKGKIAFVTTDGYSMGSVLRDTERNDVTVRFEAEHTEKDWQFVLIENGNEVYRETLFGGTYSHESNFSLCDSTVRFQRAVLYDQTGRCVLMTNPIYLVRAEAIGRKIPEYRYTEERK